MAEADIDLLDTRGRVLRLAVAIVMGFVCGFLLFGLVQMVAVPPNADPMSKLSGLEVRLGLVAVSTAIIHAVLTKVAHRRRA